MTISDDRFKSKSKLREISVSICKITVFIDIFDAMLKDLLSLNLVFWIMIKNLLLSCTKINMKIINKKFLNILLMNLFDV